MTILVELPVVWAKDKSRLETINLSHVQKYYEVNGKTIVHFDDANWITIDLSYEETKNRIKAIAKTV